MTEHADALHTTAILTALWNQNKAGGGNGKTSERMDITTSRRFGWAPAEADVRKFLWEFGVGVAGFSGRVGEVFVLAIFELGSASIP